MYIMQAFYFSFASTGYLKKIGQHFQPAKIGFGMLVQRRHSFDGFRENHVRACFFQRFWGTSDFGWLCSKCLDGSALKF